MLEFLGIHSEKFSTKKCDGNQFLKNGCRHMRKKSSRKMRLERKRTKMKTRLASPLCPIKRTHWNDEKRARGMKPKKI